MHGHAMATTAVRPPLLFCLVLLCLCCCCAPCLCAEAEVVAGGGGYAVRAVTVDKGGARLRAKLAAVAGGGGVQAAYGDDVPNLDVYASPCNELALHQDPIMAVKIDPIME